jgi:hypothetical protein
VKDKGLYAALTGAAISMLQMSLPLGFLLTLLWNAVLAPYFGVRHICVWHGIIIGFFLKLTFAFRYNVTCEEKENQEEEQSL